MSLEYTLMTMEECERLVKHALGGSESTSPGIDVAQIANEAGEFVYSMHRWDFLSRPPFLLDLRANDDTVILPEDFAEIIELVPVSGLVDTVNVVSPEFLERARSVGFATIVGTTHIAALYMPSDSNKRAIFRLYPTPTTDQYGVWRLLYRAGWIPVRNAGDRVQVPHFLKMLYRQALIAVALGYEEEREGTVIDRLEKVARSAVFQIATMRDGRSVPWAGTMSQQITPPDGLTWGDDRYTRTTLPNPT